MGQGLSDAIAESKSGNGNERSVTSHVNMPTRVVHITKMLNNNMALSIPGIAKLMIR